jgi:hypothetical protein
MYQLTEAAFERHVAEVMEEQGLSEEDAIEFVRDHEYEMIAEDEAAEADYRYELWRDAQWEREHE